MTVPNGNMALAGAVAMVANVTQVAQLVESMQILLFIGASAPLSQSWSKQWAEDSNQYYIDSLHVVSDPKYSAVAAADYAKYQMDLQQGQNEIEAQNNMLSGSKSELQTLGNAMDQIYNLMEAPIQQQKALAKLILVLGG